MSRDVVVQIEAKAGRATDALDEVQAKIDEIKQSATGASGEVQETGSVAERAFDEVSEGAGKGAEAVEKVQSELDEMKTEATSASRDLSKVGDTAERSFDDVRSSAEQAKQSIRKSGSAVDEFSGKVTTMRHSASAAANGLALELTQASQDLKYSFGGVANQLPLISQQFSDLRQRTGSTAGALSSLASTFFGPVGIIAGITLGTTFLPDLVSGLGGAADKAEEAEDKFRGFADSLQNFSDFEQSFRKTNEAIKSLIVSVEDPGFSGGAPFFPFIEEASAFEKLVSPDIVKQAGENVSFGPLRQNAEAIQEALNKDTEAAKTLRTALENINAPAALKVLKSDLQGSRKELRAFLEGAEQLDLSQLETNIGEVIEQPATVANLLEDAFAESSTNLKKQVEQGIIDPVDRAEQQSALLDEALKRIISSDFDVTNQAFGRLRRLARQARQEVKQLNEDVDPPDVPQVESDGPVIEPDVSFEGSFPTPLLDMQQRIQAIKDQAKAGLISSFQEAQKRASALRDAVVSALENGYKPSSDEVQELVRRFKEAREEASKTGQQLSDLSTSTQQLVAASRQFSSAIGSEIGQQFSNLLTGNERVQQLRERRADLQERLREAQASGDVEQARKLQEQLSSVNDELDKASNTFRQFGQAAVQALQQVIAKLASAAILAGIVSAVTGGGFGSVFGTVLGGGNIAQFFAEGGAVSGSGTSTSDSVMARLSDGEYVVNAESFSQAPGVVSAINESPSFASRLEESVGFAGGGNFAQEAAKSPVAKAFQAGGFVSVREVAPSFATAGSVLSAAEGGGTGGTIVRAKKAADESVSLEGGSLNIKIPVELVSAAERVGERRQRRKGRKGRP